MLIRDFRRCWRIDRSLGCLAIVASDDAAAAAFTLDPGISGSQLAAMSDRYSQLTYGALMRRVDTQAERKPKRWDPKLFLAAGLVYWALAEPSSRRMETVRARLSQGRQGNADFRECDLLIRQALAYIERNSLDDFIVDASATLNARERVCLLLNMVDCTASDGILEPAGTLVLFRIQRGLGVSDHYMHPLIRAVLLKNIPSVFGSSGSVVDAV